MIAVEENPTLAEGQTSDTDMRLNQLVRDIHNIRWVEYDAAAAILAKLDERLRLPRTEGKPNLLLVGEEATGKTALLNEFERRNPAYPVEYGIPVFSLNTRKGLGALDRVSMITRILSLLSIEADDVTTWENLEARVIKRLGYAHVGMIVVDQIERLPNHLRIGEQHATLEMLCRFGRELGVPIVCAGQPKAETLFERSPAASESFEVIRLPRWENLDIRFLKLLDEIAAGLPLAEHSNLIPFANEFFKRSCGRAGALVRIINRMAEDVLRTRGETCGASWPAEAFTSELEVA